MLIAAAFVTTLIYDSGFDKTYNFDAKGGNTVVQRLWATLNWQYLGSANGTYRQTAVNLQTTNYSQATWLSHQGIPGYT